LQSVRGTSIQHDGYADRRRLRAYGELAPLAGRGRECLLLGIDRARSRGQLLSLSQSWAAGHAGL